jgi:hypothetical protein
MLMNIVGVHAVVSTPHNPTLPAVQHFACSGRSLAVVDDNDAQCFRIWIRAAMNRAVSIPLWRGRIQRLINTRLKAAKRAAALHQATLLVIE